MTSRADREKATTELFLKYAINAGMRVTGDNRVGEIDAAKLIGWSVGGLRNARREGRGPSAYPIGGGRSKVSYRLSHLAAWVEEQAEIEK